MTRHEMAAGMQVSEIKCRLQKALQEGADLYARMFDMHAETIISVSHALIDCFRTHNKVIIFGNGGSAASAQHMASEFVGRYRVKRIALPVMALTADSSVLTCISNDYGYEEVFSRQIEAFGCPGDVAIAFSASGKSTNVLRAIEAAKATGMKIVGLSGSTGITAELDWTIAIPSSEIARIQELHIAAIHLICEIVDELYYA